jgi:DNA polymerase V
MPIHVDVVAVPNLSTPYACLLFLVPVSAGYPSPADDYLDGALDLNQHLIKHPTATFFVRVAGESMREAGIHSGDVLIVDRALTPSDGSVVIAVVNGELTVKRLSKRHGTLVLMPENAHYPPLPITETTAFEVWGVVTYVIHRVAR